ncbi:MAG: HEAT repeat domain-containing protein [Planctomycetota bacterium]|jgi:HEAT repeat protein
MRRGIAASLIVALCAASSAVALDAEMLGKLDGALARVPGFRHGDDSNPLREAEDIVYRASSSGDRELCDEVEKRLIATLGKATTRDARSMLCKQLRTIGTARAVPALEALLTDPESASMARFALGRIDDPEAVEALHRALATTSGAEKIGIINTLGDRGCMEALVDLMRLLRSTDKAVAEAAAYALGDLGRSRAVRALTLARRRSSGQMKDAVTDALMLAAERYVREDRKDAAARVYDPLYSTREAKHVRIGALRGLVMSKGEEAVDLLVSAIRGDDLEFQRSAIGFTRLVEGATATRAFAGLLPSLKPEAKVFMLRALGERGDRAAAPAVTEATKSGEEGVRLAAIEALGKVGDVSSIDVLVKIAASGGGNRQKVARAAREGEPGERVELIRALAGRRAAGVARELFRIAGGDDDASVRKEAIRSLGALLTSADLDRLVKLAVDPKDPADRKGVEEAVAQVCRRTEDRHGRARPILSALRGAPTEAKPVLIRLLAFAATPESLAAVRSGLEGDADTRDAAIRTLAKWPDASPADDLLKVARSAAGPIHKVLALRGYVRMAQQSEDPAAMYAKAMRLAERVDDKKLVLGGLGTADSAEALSLVEQHLDDRQLQAEAAAAAVQIADRLRSKDATRAKAALKKVMAVAQSKRLRQQAQDVINEMEKFEGFVKEWQASVQYTQKGKSGSALFDIAFAPENPNAKDVKWKKITRGIRQWDIDLEHAIKGGDNCAGYVKTRVWAPEAADARLEIGSDDAVKVWLNGKLVHANNTNRGVTPGQDKVNVKLRKGWNDLMLKVIDSSGGWGFCCRVRKADGSAFDGLKVEAE